MYDNPIIKIVTLFYEDDAQRIFSISLILHEISPRLLIEALVIFPMWTYCVCCNNVVSIYHVIILFTYCQV